MTAIDSTRAQPFASTLSQWTRTGPTKLQPIIPENGSSPAGDQVTLSAQAKGLMAGGSGANPAMGAPREFAITGIPPASSDPTDDYFAKMHKYFEDLNNFTKKTLGLGDRVGVGLTGDIINVMKKAAAKAGIVEPEMPASIKAMKEEREARSASEPEKEPGPGMKGTSLITLYMPEEEGGGQVEIWLDNKGLDKLADLSAQTVKSSLVDLMKGDDKAAAANAAIDNGIFGKAFAENAAWHPEFRTPKARMAYFDPSVEPGESPLFMIQSKAQAGYVSQHAGDLAASLINLLKAAKD
ncbi:hypothetical protein [Azospirillum brasilense]|uniref:Uncharacterized protein n=1 Tax=Azospirillum brasilense TaxID=192 RepID=A0A6L3B8G6_AZOBR|nr:hypothetical protein [Azospirillum brasilense]KAA0688911.1 hypothetical protein DS837_04160 [Azospirillum brasilense]